MKISSPSRNTSARKPSHFGSKTQSPSDGNSSTRLASIGKIGGLTGSCTPHGIPRRQMLPTYGAEKAFELNYMVQAKPWLVLQPTVQYYANLGTNSRNGNAAVAGFRIKV